MKMMIGQDNEGQESLDNNPEDNEGQESLVCCSPWSGKELDTTEQLNKKFKEYTCWFVTFTIVIWLLLEP